jgi:hypothetical protein
VKRRASIETVLAALSAVALAGAAGCIGPLSNDVLEEPAVWPESVQRELERLHPAMPDGKARILAWWEGAWPGSNDGITPGDDEIELVLAAWDDGSLAWNPTWDSGRGQVLLAQVEPELVERTAEATLAELPANAWLDTYRHMARGEPALHVYVRGDGRVARLSSAHALIERDAGVVATQFGTVALAGRTREAVLAGETGEWLRFRALWEATWNRVMRLVPPRPREE